MKRFCFLAILTLAVACKPLMLTSASATPTLGKMGMGYLLGLEWSYAYADAYPVATRAAVANVCYLRGEAALDGDYNFAAVPGLFILWGMDTEDAYAPFSRLAMLLQSEPVLGDEDNAAVVFAFYMGLARYL